MRCCIWLAVACAGFGLMMWSYFAFQRDDMEREWLFIAVTDPPDDQEPEAEPAEPLPDIEQTDVRLRLLPGGSVMQEVLAGLETSDSAAKELIEDTVCEKLIALPPDVAQLYEDRLLSGRLPVAGAHEVVAGYELRHNDIVTVDGETLPVVGVLRRQEALFRNCYLAVADPALEERLFNAEDASVRDAALLSPAADRPIDAEIGRQVHAAFPRDRFVLVPPVMRVEAGPFYLYMAGMILLLLGGSGALINFYRVLSGWIRFEPLRVIDRRYRLLWGMHLGYFGLVMATSLIVYNLPALQSVFLGLVRQELGSGDSIAEPAVRAYSSGNIPRAALVTFAINFFVGSVAQITLPSFIVPGIGVFLATIRAGAWGLLLSPTTGDLSFGMLPHSWTLLLEGEGYILAAFFAVLVPLYLCERTTESRFWQRYLRGVTVNLKGCVLVAIVLAIAACYEAVEVILMKQ